MRLGLIFAGSVALLAAVIVLFGAPGRCSPAGNAWYIWYQPLCRSDAAAHEPSLIYAIPLALVLVVWLFKKIFRANDAA